MIRVILTSFVLIVSINVRSQDTVKMFYVSRIATTVSDSSLTNLYDSILLSQCDKIQYRGAMVRITFFRNKQQIGNFTRSVSTYKQWGDSVMLNLDVPKGLYDQSDSISIAPTHQFACDGFKGDFLKVDGEEKQIKNIKLKFISNPAQAIVYLIPKFAWERDPQLTAKSGDALSQYRISGGITPVWSPVQEYVYVCLFKYNDQYMTIECSPTYKNPVDSVYADFIRR